MKNVGNNVNLKYNLCLTWTLKVYMYSFKYCRMYLKLVSVMTIFCFNRIYLHTFGLVRQQFIFKLNKKIWAVTYLACLNTSIQVVLTTHETIIAPTLIPTALSSSCLPSIPSPTVFNILKPLWSYKSQQDQRFLHNSSSILGLFHIPIIKQLPHYTVIFFLRER